MKADYINDCSNWAESEGVSAAYYHAAAARARKLHAEATTPRLKRYLQELIIKCEGLARKVQAELNDASQFPCGSNQDESIRVIRKSIRTAASTLHFIR